MNINRQPPTPAGPGTVTCRVCGREWITTDDQDAFLAELDDHDRTHDRPETGTAPSSATPDISTR